MKTLIRTFLICSVFASFDSRAIEDSPLPILGEWQFYKMVLDGTEMPPRDPRLDLRYEFFDNGENRLYWTYDQGSSFCERKGQYLYKDGFLMDEIVWVNPKNRADCGADVDMQLGRKSVSPMEVVGDDLVLHIPFTNKEILYHWRKIEKP